MYCTTTSRVSMEVGLAVRGADTTTQSPPCSPPPATPHSQFFLPQSAKSRLSPIQPLLPQGTSHLPQSVHHPLLLQLPQNNHFCRSGLRLSPHSLPHHPGLPPNPYHHRGLSPQSLSPRSRGFNSHTFAHMGWNPHNNSLLAPLPPLPLLSPNNLSKSPTNLPFPLSRLPSPNSHADAQTALQRLSSLLSGPPPTLSVPTTPLRKSPQMSMEPSPIQSSPESRPPSSTYSTSSKTLPSPQSSSQPTSKPSAEKPDADKSDTSCGASGPGSQATSPNSEERTSASEHLTVNRPTIDCPVCGDTAINHFHYGGMCCYSCKAFFRRVVNTSKATKYKCRSGNNSCDVSLANRRSCQACRYNKCLAAGMKPGLVLSDIQCQRRFGPRKGRAGKSPHNDGNYDMFGANEDDYGGTHLSKDREEDSSNDPAGIADDNEVPAFIRNEDDMIRYRTILEPSIPSVKKKLVGRQLFFSLFRSSCSTPSDPEPQDVEEDRDVFVSFQMERQMKHARDFVQFTHDRKTSSGDLILASGQVNTFSVIQTLVEQTILLLKHNPDFRSLPPEDQTALVEANMMSVSLLSCTDQYHPNSRTFSWRISSPDRQRMKERHGLQVGEDLEFGLEEVLQRVEGGMEDVVAQVFKFSEMFAKIGLPKQALYILLFATVFNHENCSIVHQKEVMENRVHYLNLLFQSLQRTEGVSRACRMAARLQAALAFLGRLAEIVGQKFINIYQQQDNVIRA